MLWGSQKRKQKQIYVLLKDKEGEGRSIFLYLILLSCFQLTIIFIPTWCFGDGIVSYPISQAGLMHGFFKLLPIFYFTASSSSFFFCFFAFQGCTCWHMEVPRLGVRSELQLSAYVTASATPDLSYVCHLHHSSQQCQILDPLSEARD